MTEIENNIGEKKESTNRINNKNTKEDKPRNTIGIGVLETTIHIIEKSMKRFIDYNQMRASRVYRF